MHMTKIKKHQVAVEDPSRDCGLDFDSLQQKVRPFTNGLACMGPPDAHLGAGMGTHALPTLEGVGEGEQAKGQMPHPCQYVPPAPRRAGLGERSRDSVLRLRQYGEGAAPRPNEKRKPDLPRPLPGDSVGGGAITPREGGSVSGNPVQGLEMQFPTLREPGKEGDEDLAIGQSGAIRFFPEKASKFS